MEIELLAAFSPRPTRGRLQARGPVLRFLGLLAIASATGFLPSSLLPASSASDLIRDENRKAGRHRLAIDARPRPTRTASARPGSRATARSRASRPARSIDIMVSTDPPRRFRIEIFRMGYYGGRGARLMTTLGPFEGKAQPVPAPGPKNLHECRWEPSATLDDPRRLAQRRLPRPAHDAGRSRDVEPYWQSYVVFIVRDDRPADILFQCSDNTWQAYNRWPNNYSVYTHPEGNAGALGRRQLRPPLRPRGPVRRRRQRPAHRSARASSCRSSSRWPTGSSSTATT